MQTRYRNANSNIMLPLERAKPCIHGAGTSLLFTARAVESATTEKLRRLLSRRLLRMQQT